MSVSRLGAPGDTDHRGGQAGAQVTIRDISRGGIGLEYDCKDKPGAKADVTLPGGGSVSGRISRTANGLLGVTFFQDAASLAQIDRALAFIEANQSQHAA
jgi:hypothetical protein